MGKIETMYWDAIVSYFSKVKSDTFINNYKDFTEIAKVEYETVDTNKTEITINFNPDFNYNNSLLGFMGKELYIFSSNEDETKIGCYKPDFLIFVGNKKYSIEIDGHNFHEKTKEQVKADKKKDRYYIRQGFIPIRFTGSEVYQNAIDCVRETVLTIIFDLKHSCDEERILTSFYHSFPNEYKE